MHKSNYFVFDLETGGLEPTENPITQFACVILDYKTLKEIDRWETFVKPYNDLKITREALESTMLSMSDINSGISIKQFNKTCAEYLKSFNAAPKKPEFGRLVAIGQNVTFDIGFMKYAFELDKLNFNDFVYENFIDTFPLAKATFGITGEEKLNLKANCKNADIVLTDAHGAMNDVEATADLFRFFVKRLRKGGSTTIEDKKQRKKGIEFFEFKCAKDK